MLKSVIFDMDGVIIDSEPEHLRSEQELFKALGIVMAEDDHLEEFVGTTSHYMWGALKNRFSLPQTVEELVKSERESYYNFLISRNHTIDLIKGAKELIQDLYKNGVTLAIASSSPMNVIEAVVDMYGIREYFVELVTGDYVERSKPNPDIFLYAARKVESMPEECIVIEDSANGVLAAKRAGMKCIGYKNLNSGNQNLSPADLIINSFNEIDYGKLKDML